MPPTRTPNLTPNNRKTTTPATPIIPATPVIPTIPVIPATLVIPAKAGIHNLPNPLMASRKDHLSPLMVSPSNHQQTTLRQSSTTSTIIPIPNNRKTTTPATLIIPAILVNPAIPVIPAKAGIHNRPNPLMASLSNH